MRITKTCPECGRWPILKVWHVAIRDNMVYQLQLECKDGRHICATSYSEDLEKIKIDWERIVNENINKMKGKK